MASAVEAENLFWAIGILALPLILALPMKLLYQTVILGVGPAERSYRSTVQRIIDAGMQVEHFRGVLDDEARKLGVKPGRARLNETDLLYPLTITHFLLTPMLLILPVVAVVVNQIVVPRMFLEHSYIQNGIYITYS